MNPRDFFLAHRTTFIVIAAAVLAAFIYRAFISPPRVAAQQLAYTECPFFGDARVVVTGNVAPEDTMPVRWHEEVHARECREMGPFRIRWKNLSTSGRLELEAPAYCAGAHARLAQKMDTVQVRARLFDDFTAAFGGQLDSVIARDALRSTCPDIAATPIP